MNTFFLTSYDESDDSIVLNSLLTMHIPVTTFDVIENQSITKFQRFWDVYQPNEIHFSRMNIPATSVIITISSSDILGLILLQFKNSIWWNHNAKFLIINWSAGGCENAFEVLDVVWTFRILHALYLCRNQYDQLGLYSFNPFSTRAPKLWKKIANPSKTNKYWTLLEYRFTDGK